MAAQLGRQWRFIHKRPNYGAACAAATNPVTSDLSFHINTST
jgi:hypothetical protein